MPNAVHPVTGFSKEISDGDVADYEERGWHVNGVNAQQSKGSGKASKKSEASPSAGSAGPEKS